MHRTAFRSVYKNSHHTYRRELQHSAADVEKAIRNALRKATRLAGGPTSFPPPDWHLHNLMAVRKRARRRFQRPRSTDDGNMLKKASAVVKWYCVQFRKKSFGTPRAGPSSLRQEMRLSGGLTGVPSPRVPPQHFRCLAFVLRKTVAEIAEIYDVEVCNNSVAVINTQSTQPHLAAQARFPISPTSQVGTAAFSREVLGSSHQETSRSGTLQMVSAKPSLQELIAPPLQPTRARSRLLGLAPRAGALANFGGFSVVPSSVSEADLLDAHFFVNELRSHRRKSAACSDEMSNEALKRFHVSLI